VFRLAYLYFFLLVIPYPVLSLLMPGAWDIGAELRWWYIKIFEHWQVVMGLMGSDIIHYMLDVATTEHKSARNQIKKPCRPIRLSFRNA